MPTLVHTILLYQEQTDIPDQLLHSLNKVLKDCDAWWATKGADLHHLAPVAVCGHNIDLTLANPWNQVYARLEGDTYPAADRLLVLIDGWDSGQNPGWGGPPMAIVGEAALRALESLGAPEAIVDDWQAGFLILHEIGHTLGLAHDFDTPNSAMGYGWCGFNAILGADHWARPQGFIASGDIAPELDAPAACGLPPSSFDPRMGGDSQ